MSGKANEQFRPILFIIMKKLFLSLVAMIVATVSFAQTSLLATLSHDGTISTFYGTTALKDALATADNGDVITLSAGQFFAADITKAVTLRGAGMNVRNDAENRHESSIVQGAFNINIEDDVPNRLIVEGLYFTGDITYTGKVSNALFMKSRFRGIKGSTGVAMVNSSFIHCRIADCFYLADNSNVSLVNSVVYNPNNDGKSASNFEFDNCEVVFTSKSNGYYGYVSDVLSSYYKNCIILESGTGNTIPSSNVAYNCVGMSPSGSVSIFRYMISKNNTNTMIYGSAFTTLFKTLASYSYTDSEMYELTDEAKQTYLGADDKEVGIYGGNLPYDEDPTTPQITKCNVAAKSTADGKLSVDIEVKAAEY